MSLAVRLRTRVGALALDVDFETPTGVTALFGPSGAGKTSLIAMVAGLQRPDAGRIVLDGETLLDTETGTDLPPPRRRIGYVFQEGRLFPHLTVRQNLRFGAWFAPKDAPGPDFDSVVALLGIEPLLARRPGRLSGGERQRVALGRALLARPRILLMDEPLAALDAARKAEILPFLESLRDESGLPILYVSHSQRETIRLATTVVGLDGGRVTRIAPPATFFGLDPEAGSGPVATLSARLLAPPGRAGIARLAVAGGALTLDGPETHGLAGAPTGQGFALRIGARDVILAAADSALAARNQLAGIIERIDLRSEETGFDADDGWSAGDALATLRLPGDQRLYALAPAAALEKAGLAPGVEAKAVVLRASVAARG